MLPLNDLAILGSVSPATPQDDVDRLVSLVARTVAGACIRVDAVDWDRASIRRLAENLRRSIAMQSAMNHIPLVLLVRENLGKALGQLITDWGRSPAKVAVIDEIDPVDAQFACVGRLHHGVAPVSFYRMNASGE
jgi:ethanolamine utilization protein EutA (predicted chaperonin)